ncbi:hypothetical protein BCR42DRAFT_398193 [Absidia repens]|uniref:Uncharacterized protein n=1 Tax=Absidia repens TaxID=90262 RepID=A0A1X2HZ88_9FUNG|nr:hypothetical protein BCR42DRAFT_398193 [Absidia repens]
MTTPVMILLCRSRYLWYISLVMTMAMLAGVLTSVALVPTADPIVWRLACLLWGWTFVLGTECQYFLSRNWKCLLALPWFVLRFVVSVACRLLVWPLVAWWNASSVVPLSSFVWKVPLAVLLDPLRDLDCSDVFYAPPSITRMHSWRRPRLTRQDITRYNHHIDTTGRMESMAIDTETYGPCRSMPCAMREQDLARRGGRCLGPRKLNAPWPGGSTETLPYFLDVPWQISPPPPLIVKYDLEVSMFWPTFNHFFVVLVCRVNHEYLEKGEPWIIEKDSPFLLFWAIGAWKFQRPHGRFRFSTVPPLGSKTIWVLGGICFKNKDIWTLLVYDFGNGRWMWSWYRSGNGSGGPGDGILMPAATALQVAVRSIYPMTMERYPCPFIPNTNNSTLHHHTLHSTPYTFPLNTHMNYPNYHHCHESTVMNNIVFHDLLSSRIPWQFSCSSCPTSWRT